MVQIQYRECPMAKNVLHLGSRFGGNSVLYLLYYTNNKPSPIGLDCVKNFPSFWTYTAANSKQQSQPSS